jgi:hypothetical protein
MDDKTKSEMFNQSIEEKIMEKGFDHPCRETCSGWKQGLERGVFDSKEDIERLKKLVFVNQNASLDLIQQNNTLGAELQEAKTQNGLLKEVGKMEIMSNKWLWFINTICLLFWIGLTIDRYFLAKPRMIAWLIQKTKNEHRCPVCERPMIIISDTEES